MQEDEDSEQEESRSLLDITVDQNGTEDEDNDNQDKLLIGKAAYQVSDLEIIELRKFELFHAYCRIFNQTIFTDVCTRILFAPASS